MSEARGGATPWVIGATPLIITWALFETVEPLLALRDTRPQVFVLCLSLSLFIGVVIARRSQIVKDHEYLRQKSMRSLHRSYRAEERGVWGQSEERLLGPGGDVSLGPLGKRALSRLDGDVSQFVQVRETTEIERTDSDQDTVNLLIPSVGSSPPLDIEKPELELDRASRPSILSGMGARWKRVQNWRHERRKSRLSHLAASMGLEVKAVAGSGRIGGSTPTTVVTDDPRTRSPQVDPKSNSSARRCTFCDMSFPSTTRTCPMCGLVL